MESLSQTLQPYKGIVGSAASYVTIAQFFSGAFVCRDIYKKGNTEGISAIPFIGGVSIGTLMLKHGFIMGDDVMIQVNIFAIVLNIIYSIIFYLYATDKYNEFLKPAAVGAAVVAIFLGYAEYESPENLDFRYGTILTILMLALLGAPLVDVKKIIQEKDASSIPFPITIMAALTTFLWLLYGIILRNEFMLIQNIVGFLLCLFQLILIFVYPKRNQESKKPIRGKND